jgi:TPR repeat protein
MLRPMQLGWVVVLLFVFSSSALAERAAPCASGAACVEKGDALRLGRLIEPDRAAAVAAYEKACQLGEARGCLEAARLYQRGWMFEVERKRDRARELATEASKKAPACGTSEACVVGFEAQLLVLEQSPPIDSVKASATQLVADAQKGCDKTAEACRWIYDNASWFSNHGYLEKNVVDPMRDKAAAAIESQCKKTNHPTACYWAGKYAKRDEIAAKYFDPACKANYKNACWLYWEARFDSTKPADLPGLFKESLDQLLPICDKNPSKECSELGQQRARAALPRRHRLRRHQDCQGHHEGHRACREGVQRR